MRRILNEAAADGAVAAAHRLVRTWPTLYGNNFMVATPAAGEGRDFAGVLEYDNRGDLDEGATLRTRHWRDAAAEPFLLCSNHFRFRDVDSGSADGNCGRYDRLHRRLEEERKAGTKLDEGRLFEVLSLAALPPVGTPQESYRHGTLHQAVALTGSKTLFLKRGTPGRNIRDVEPFRLDVPAALATAKPPEPASTAATGGR